MRDGEDGGRGGKREAGGGRGSRDDGEIADLFYSPPALMILLKALRDLVHVVTAQEEEGVSYKLM